MNVVRVFLGFFVVYHIWGIHLKPPLIKSWCSSTKLTWVNGAVMARVPPGDTQWIISCCQSRLHSREIIINTEDLSTKSLMWEIISKGKFLLSYSTSFNRTQHVLLKSSLIRIRKACIYVVFGNVIINFAKTNLYPYSWATWIKLSLQLPVI